MKVDIFTTDNRYNIIYADPPWNYDNNLIGRTDMGAKPYNTMTTQSICNLPIQNICAKDSILFLWVTMPKLQEGLQVITSWGFTYKTCGFCWVKQNPSGQGIYSGLGHWVNGNAELCLLATNGHPHRVSRNVKQIVFSPRGSHSVKPPEVRDRIVALMGDNPRIELFARQAVAGWDCWGNEAPND